MAISRRDVLRNATFGASSLLLAPLFTQLKAQAAGVEAARPMRFVFVVEGNGLPWKQIQPVGIERSKEHQRTQLIDQPIGDYALPRALEPIAAWKDRVNIIQGFSGRIAGGGHSCNFGALGVYGKGGGTPLGETIDIALGKKLGGIFPQVGLGMIEKENAVVYNCSAWAKGKPMPTTCSPMVAYGNLFGSVAGGSAKQEFLARTNVLDFLLDDVKRMRGQVAAAEREKLDTHIDAYESMRDRQSRLNEIEDTLREQAPVTGNKYTSPVETDRLDAQFDIGAAALIGGLTNVLTLASGVGEQFFGVKFTGLGITIGKHGIGHGGSADGMNADELGTKIRRYHFELIARLMKKLEAVPEGDGTMLDNTCIVYLSDAAEGHHSRCWEWPFVVIGNLGGKLKTGRYIEYPYWNFPGHREYGSLYNTLLHCVGDYRDYFGVHEPTLIPEAIGSGPLPELLA